MHAPIPFLHKIVYPNINGLFTQKMNNNAV